MYLSKPSHITTNPGRTHDMTTTNPHRNRRFDRDCLARIEAGQAHHLASGPTNWNGRREAWHIPDMATYVVVLRNTNQPSVAGMPAASEQPGDGPLLIGNLRFPPTADAAIAELVRQVAAEAAEYPHWDDVATPEQMQALMDTEPCCDPLGGMTVLTHLRTLVAPTAAWPTAEHDILDFVADGLRSLGYRGVRANQVGTSAAAYSPSTKGHWHISAVREHDIRESPDDIGTYFIAHVFAALGGAETLYTAIAGDDSTCTRIAHGKWSALREAHQEAQWAAEQAQAREAARLRRERYRKAREERNAQTSDQADQADRTDTDDDA